MILSFLRSEWNDHMAMTPSELHVLAHHRFSVLIRVFYGKLLHSSHTLGSCLRVLCKVSRKTLILEEFRDRS